MLLYLLRRELWFINSSLQDWSFSVKILKQEPIVLIKPLCLPSNFIKIGIGMNNEGFDIFSAIAPSAPSIDQARKEFQTTGKIEGFELFNLQSYQKFWVSHYDFNLTFYQN